MTFDDVRRIASPFPETVETASYGTPSFKVGKKMLCRPREEGNVLVVPTELTALLSDAGALVATPRIRADWSDVAADSGRR